MRSSTSALVLSVALAAGASCSGQPSVDPSDEVRTYSVVGGLPGGEVTISRGAREVLRLRVEIAETGRSRARGLMEVSELPDDYGMVFIFEDEGQTGFWMKNTLISLDIAFWNQDFEIVDVLTMLPCTEDPCRIYRPVRPYLGAVETAAGALSSLREGDAVSITRS